MDWLTTHLDDLAKAAAWPYVPAGPGATEPAALAALALAAHDRAEAAAKARRWLLDRQQPGGALGLDERSTTPHWPTALAVLAWQAALDEQPAASDAPHCAPAVGKGVQAMLAEAGKAMQPNPRVIGHDPTIAGWTWAEGTHSWQEPTAMCVLALKAAGQSEHQRTRDGVRMLIDRLLPDGGCNYGNTTVLGQLLLPHLEPTGLALLALAGERDPSGRLAKSVAWAARAVRDSRTAASLGWGLLGLAAHDQFPTEAVPDWLAETAARTKRGAFPPRLTLLALAARGPDSPLVRMAQTILTPGGRKP